MLAQIAKTGRDPTCLRTLMTEQWSRSFIDNDQQVDDVGEKKPHSHQTNLSGEFAIGIGTTEQIYVRAAGWREAARTFEMFPVVFPCTALRFGAEEPAGILPPPNESS